MKVLKRGILMLLFAISVLSCTSLQPVYAGTVFDQLLGMYSNGSEQILIRERNGCMELLYNTEPAPDKMFLRYSGFPMQAISKNTYKLLNYGPTQRESSSMRFETDKNGRGVYVLIGSKRFKRNLFDAESGMTFKIKPLMSTSELKKRALSAKPPVEKGNFVKPELVELTKLDPSIKLDIRYATTNNFMGIKLYDQPRAFLQREAAEALARVSSRLSRYGYGLVIHDAYRPWYVTKMFWDATPDSQKDFVADPSKGSRHNRGGAVDLSLYYLKTGNEADMGSGYDEFSIRAHPLYPGGTTEQRELRTKLRVLMEGEGFKIFHNEWWHFDYRQWKQYPILNLGFDEIKP